MKFLILLLLVGCAAQEGQKVVGITDGDTIKVLVDNKPVKVRLAEIDCPEARQAFGTKAKQYTADLAFGKSVRIITKGKDRYGRTLAEVILPDGKNLNKELVRSGLAWQYKQYSKTPEYKRLEEEARTNKRGLWVDKNPVPPWKFREKPHARIR